MGAAYMGAQKASYNLPRDYSKNVLPLYKHSQNNCVSPAMPQKSTALTREFSRPVSAVNGVRNASEERKISEIVYGLGSSNGNSGENGHGSINNQVSEITVGLKSMAKEKPIST